MNYYEWAVVDCYYNPNLEIKSTQPSKPSFWVMNTEQFTKYLYIFEQIASLIHCYEDQALRCTIKY